ncbi:hypothetical protein EZ437_02880 [Pedobacter psychroterrae]|uniref:Uncharacterized protein n=1 Tax=Pedobacter psychroterrae TaxID=2530453 RepID=A0A4R0NY27_9SPHI|nr:hypothetical protein EZ437_02880 [Pedobacter psychroterrae]
MLILKALCS